jgi:hypothetical protein
MSLEAQTKRSVKYLALKMDVNEKAQIRSLLWLAFALTSAWISYSVFIAKTVEPKGLEMLLVIIVAPALPSFVFLGLFFSLHDLLVANRPIQNTAINETRFQRHIEEGLSFCLYLRSFSLETSAGGEVRGGPYASSTFQQELGHSPPLTFFPNVENKRENAIVDYISRHLPVFALVNERDLSIGSAERIRVSNDQWKSRFLAAAEASTLLIMIVESPITENVLFELQWLVKEPQAHRCWLVGTDSTLRSADHMVPGLLEIVRWITYTIETPNLSIRLQPVSPPDGLESYLKSIFTVF